MINAHIDKGIKSQVKKNGWGEADYKESVVLPPRLSKIVTHVTQIARRVFNGCGASVLMLDKETGALTFTAVTGKAVEQLRGVKVSAEVGIAGWVALHGEPLIVNDVSKDLRFNETVDRATGFITKSLMCAPLVEDRRVIGVIEVVNDTDWAEFNQNDLDGLVLIASLAAFPICFFKEERVRLELVQLALGSKFPVVRTKCIDALTIYGEAAIPEILTIVRKSVTKGVREHGLVKIEGIKNGKLTT